MEILAASAVVRDPSGRYLLVQRSVAPEAGRWTFPGGKVEPGETLREAVVREVYEETGVRARILQEAGVLRRPAGDGTQYEIHSFSAEYLSGEPIACGDAAAAGWFTVLELRTLPLTRGLLDHLQRRGLYP